MPNTAKFIQNLSDEDLADLVIQGDHQAFTILVKRHSTNFYKTAYFLTNSKTVSEDIVQDCLLKFWQFPKKWNSTKNVKFTTWFTKVVINRSYDVLKKKKPDLLKEDFDIKDERENAIELIEEKRRNHIFDKAFSSLNDKQKTALVLTVYNEMKNDESAKIMGLKLKTFQSLLLRSKANLKEEFEKLGGLL